MTVPGYQPPPDLTAYVDLRIFDRTDQEIAEAGIAGVALNLPDWVPREGHAQPVTAGVLTPNGYVKMGDLCVGDHVIDPAGGVSSVTGIYPQGMKSVYRITTDDGGVTEASDDHLWSIVVKRNGLRRGAGRRNPSRNVEVVRRTVELADLVSTGATARLPRIAPCDQAVPVDLPVGVDPWLVGFLIGDGNLYSNYTKVALGSDEEAAFFAAHLPAEHRLTRYATYDYGVIGPARIRGTNLVTGAMRELGLAGRTAVNKMIPEPFFTAPVPDRIALLQGLVDSDGTVDRQGRAWFDTVSGRLAEGVQRLLWSLGERASVQVRAPREVMMPQGRVCRGAERYRISIRPETFIPARLLRKADRYRPPTSGQRYRKIVSVDYVGERECQCISVSAPSQLYVTDDYLPTHNTEVVILEGVALEHSEAIVAVNRLPGAVTEGLLMLFEVFKSYGAAPTASAQVFCADVVGHTIPGGTRMYLPTTDGTSIVTMLVEPPGVIIAPGSGSGVVLLIADVFTAGANGSPIGTLLQMASPMPWVDRIELTTAVVDGLDPESDEAWRDRGVQRLARLSDALVIPRHFEAAALEDPRVFRVVAVDNNDPTTGGVGDDPGHITVAVLGDGATISAPAKAEIEAALEAKAVGILDVHVTDIAIVTVTLTVTVRLVDVSDSVATTAAVEQALIDYLDPMTWSYGTTVYRNEIISLVDQVPGVDRVVTVAITGQDGAGDYPLPTASTLPTATAASVTVTLV